MLLSWHFRHSWAFFRSARFHFAFIVIGLVFSFTAIVLAIQAVSFDLGYDNSFKNRDRIFRVVSVFTFNHRQESFAISSCQLAPLLDEESDAIEAFTRMRQIQNAAVVFGEQNFFEAGFFYADSGFTKVFHPTVLEGDVRRALASSGSVALTQSLAGKYFRTSRNAIDKIIQINGQAFFISAVVADPPANSHLRYEALVSYESLNQTENRLPRASELWNVKDYTYLLLKGRDDLAGLIIDFPKIYERHMAFNGVRLNATFVPMFQPINDTHYDRGFQYDLPTGNIYTVYGLVGLIILILFISISNYSVLVAGLYSGRIKEVGVRRIWGEARLTIAVRFFLEALVVTIIGVIFSLIFIYILQATVGLSVITNRELTLDMNSLDFILRVVLILLLFCFLSTFYSTRIITAAPVTLALRRVNSFKISRSVIQTGLLTMQFAMCHFCLSSIELMTEQMNYIRQSNPGFPIENLAIIRFYDSQNRLSDYLKREVANVNFVESSALSGSIPGAFENSRLVFEVEAREGKEKMTFDVIYSDEDFPQTIGLELVDGNFLSSTQNSIALINERAAKGLGWPSAVGKTMNLVSGQPITIVGVFKDFDLYPLRKYEPLVIVKENVRFNYLSVRLNESKIPELKHHLDRQLSQDFTDGKVFFSSLTDFFYSKYNDEKNQIYVLAALGLVSIALCVKGVLGMSLLYAQYQQQNYAIRKVFGAMNIDLIKIGLLNILKPVSVGIIISIPFVNVFFSQWLDNFEVKGETNFLTVLYVGVIIAVVAILSILYQVIKLAMVNPARILSRE